MQWPGSQCYMSDMLDFEFDDGEECDETTEQDLIIMEDISIKFELKVGLLLIVSIYILGHVEKFLQWFREKRRRIFYVLLETFNQRGCWVAAEIY